MMICWKRTNKIWNKVINYIKNRFGSKPAYNEKYLKNHNKT